MSQKIHFTDREKQLILYILPLTGYVIDDPCIELRIDLLSSGISKKFFSNQSSFSVAELELMRDAVSLALDISFGKYPPLLRESLEDTYSDLARERMPLLLIKHRLDS